MKCYKSHSASTVKQLGIVSNDRTLFDASSIRVLNRQRCTMANILKRLAESDFSTRREDQDLAGILNLLDRLRDVAMVAGVRQ
jgi:hypothetical protein